MTLSKVQEGEPWQPSAEAHNVVVDVHRDISRLLSQFRAGHTRSTLAAGMIQVENQTGSDRERYDVVGLHASNIVFSSDDDLQVFQNGPVLHAVHVDQVQSWPVTTHVSRIAVLLEPIADGKIGLACTSGVVPAHLSAIGSQIPFHAYPYWDGYFTYWVEDWGGPAQTLWKPPAQIGLEWCVIKLLGSFHGPRYIGQLTGTVLGSDSAFAVDNVYPLNGMSPTTTANETMWIQNPFGLSGLNNALCRFEWSYHPSYPHFATHIA